MNDLVYIQISRYTQPVLIILGTAGAIMNQVLFYSRRSLRASSCSLYFRALSLNDLFVLYVVVFPLWYINQFGDDPAKQWNWYCKLKIYINYTCYTLSPYFLVLACFDRLCTSSTSAGLRKLATIRFAIYLIFAMTILIYLIYFHVPIWFELVHYPTASACTTPSVAYTKTISIFLLLFLCIIPPSLMITICVLTLIGFRRQRRRIMPINQARARQRDNQLLKMLFNYVLTHIVCTVPFTVAFLIYVFSPAQSTPTLRTVVQLSILLLNVNFATSFYTFTLCTPFYRDELYNFFRAGRRRTPRASIPTINTP